MISVKSGIVTYLRNSCLYSIIVLLLLYNFGRFELKKAFFIFAIIFLSVCLSSFAKGSGENGGKSESKILTDNIIKWKNADIKDYRMAVSYVSGNRPEEIYTLEVRDKILAEWKDSDDKAVSKNFVKQFTVENLFSEARKYIKTNKKNSFMFYIFEYDDKLGYINSLTCIYNPKVKSRDVPSDRNFKIKVLSFVRES